MENTKKTPDDKSPTKSPLRKLKKEPTRRGSIFEPKGNRSSSEPPKRNSIDVSLIKKLEANKEENAQSNSATIERSTEEKPKPKRSLFSSIARKNVILANRLIKHSQSIKKQSDPVITLEKNPATKYSEFRKQKMLQDKDKTNQENTISVENSMEENIESNETPKSQKSVTSGFTARSRTMSIDVTKQKKKKLEKTNTIRTEQESQDLSQKNEAEKSPKNLERIKKISKEMFLGELKFRRSKTELELMEELNKAQEKKEKSEEESKTERENESQLGDISSQRVLIRDFSKIQNSISSPETKIDGNKGGSGRSGRRFGTAIGAITKETMSEVKRLKKELSHNCSLEALLSTIFLLLVVLSLFMLTSIISYSYQERMIYLWVDQFLHGMILGSIQIFFFKFMINLCYDEHDDEETTFLINWRAINIFCGVLIILSGFLMIIFAAATFSIPENPLIFVGMELIVLFIDARIIIKYIDVKIKAELSEKQKSNLKKGFFSFPVYKDFLSEIGTSRDKLNQKNNVFDPIVLAKLGKPIPKTTNLHEKETLKEEENKTNSNKKKLSDIITKKKIEGSQYLILYCYLQLFVVSLFCYLYNLCEENKVYPAVIFLLLIYQPSMTLLKRKIEIWNKAREAENFLIYLRFISSLCESIFSRVALFVTQQLGFVIILLAMKFIYKIIKYAFYGSGKEQFKEYFAKLKEKFKRAPKDEVSPRSPVRRSTKRKMAIARPGSRGPKIRAKANKDLFEKEVAETVVNLREGFESRFAVTFAFREFGDLFSGVSIFVICLIYRSFENGHFYAIKEWKDMRLFLIAIGVDVALEVFFFIFILIIWKKDKKFSRFQYKEMVKLFLGEFFLLFIMTNLTIFNSYSYILQTLENYVCCD